MADGGSVPGADDTFLVATLDALDLMRARAERAEADADRLATALGRDTCSACGAVSEVVDAALFLHDEAVKARG